MLEYVTAYLKSTNQTPGQYGSVLWSLIYILAIFAGLSVAVIAMNWLERKILATCRCGWGRCGLARTACCSQSLTR
jgi:NADH:ubiquinone oxidoreductase subunit H